MAKDMAKHEPAAEPAKPDRAPGLGPGLGAGRPPAAAGPAPRRRRAWALALVLFFVALAAAGGWAWRERQAAVAADATAPPPPPMQLDRSEIVVVEPLTLRRSVRVIGSLEPARRAELSAETAGRVEEVLGRPGDPVAAGAPLLRIDVERLTIELDLARSNADATRAQLRLADEQLARAQELVARGVLPANALDEARSNAEALAATLAAQEDQVAAAELAREGALLEAPFDGVVATRAVEPGEVVAAGTPLLSIVDLSQVELRGAAPLRAGAAIRPGQAVEVEVEGIDGRRFAGEVLRIAPLAEEGTRSLTVFIGIANDDRLLLGGMFATGEIVLAEREGAFALPAEALREDAQGRHVLVVRDGAVERRAVETGAAWAGDLIEVTGGLGRGDLVVALPLAGLDPGEAVELTEF
jgi:RND family efflux transporter MFP subunit